MRKLSKILSIVLVLVMMLSIVPVISASAANIPGGMKLYLVPNANWNESNARFAAYFFGDGEAWVSMTKVAGESNLYEVTVPEGKNFTNIIFCRMNPSATANNWNNKWNQTSDLVYNGTSNCYTVKEGTWDKGAGTWSTYGSTCAHANVGPAATCTTPQKCLDCGDPVVSELGHTYNASHLCTRCNAQATFTVAGSGAHLGTEWDTGNTANDMTYADGVYTKVYTNVAAGTYKFKVARDHDWGTAYPSADKSFTVATAGSTVTITLKGTTVDVKVEVPHTCAFVDGKCTCGEFDPTYTVVDSLEALNAALLNGGNILLNADITASEIIVISQPTVLVGGGHTITSTAARGINISGADGVVIKNLTLVAGGERGFNVISGATNITIDNVTATAANYTVNFAGSAANAVLTVKNSTLTGLNVVNVATAGVQVTLVDTKLVCDDQTDVENYGAITISPNCAGVTVLGTGVEFDVKGNSSKVVNSSDASITFTDAEVEVNNQVATIVYGDYAYTFSTLEAAFAKAVYGETVVLLADIDVESITVPYTVKLDLNGHTITGEVIYELPPFPEVVVTPIENPELTFALNFGIKDVETFSEEYVKALLETYGDMYVDYRLTIEGLTADKVVFNANGGANGFLGGQYDDWSENWVYVPFENVEIANGGSLMIMEYAAELMGKGGLRQTLADIVAVVVNFDCGVFFTEEFLLANPHMKVTLDLIVFTEDAEGNKILLNGAPVATNVFYGHDHVYETVVTAPTCTEAGYTTHTCACGETYTDNEVPALGHTAGADATCTEAQTCTVCGAELAAKLAHVDTGLDAKCDVCGSYFLPTSPFKLEMYQASKKQTYYFTGAMSGYYFATSTDITKAVDLYAEEVDGGYNVYFMNGSTKNYLYIELSGTHINAKFGSTKAVWYVDPTYGCLTTEVSGAKYFLGTYSSYVTFGGTAYTRLTASTADVSQYVGRAVSLENHVCADFTEKVTNPTCTAQGYTTKTCTACGVATKVDYVDALGHDLVDVEGLAATCTTAGYTAHKDCSRCTYIEGKDTIEALGHDYKYDVCSACGEIDPAYASVTHRINFSTWDNFDKETHADGDIVEYNSIFTFIMGKNSRVDASAKAWDDFAGAKRFSLGGKTNA